uniref:Uncharacterized protein n=1 Tax=Anguilla anguilla TaxID=7936 RepID=A0A0E9R4Q1_ANGAN
MPPRQHSHGRRHYVFGFSVHPSVCPSVPILVNAISQEALREFLQIWHKRPLGLKDELNRFLVVKGQRSRSL